MHHPFPTRSSSDRLSAASFDNVEKRRQATFDFRDSHSGRIQVAAVPTLAETLLAKPVAAFLESRPRVSLSVKLLPTDQIVSRVALQQADLGLLYGPIDDSSIKAENLPAARVVCAVNRRHPLAAKGPISPGA